MRKKIFNQNGMVLPIVLIIIVVLMLLTAALVNTSNFEINQSKNHEKRLQAYYLAMSAADAVGKWIEEAETQEVVLTLKGKDSGWQILDEDTPGEIRIEVANTQEPYLINIISTGKVNEVVNSITLTLIGQEVQQDPEDPVVVEWSRHWSK